LSIIHGFKHLLMLLINFFKLIFCFL
jgi:hypothetical protein